MSAGPVSALDFEYDHGGLWFPALQLWLDPHAPKTGPERVFISHAHSDHIAAHREVILSAPTRALLQARLKGERVERVLPWDEPATFETGGLPWQIRLLPAGHILGSAMARIEVEGASLLYTGDFKLRPGLSAEPCEPRPADTLIMETTFGRPEYCFPPAEEVLSGVERFCREALDNDEVPVLLGYSLGKSQELLKGLQAAGLALQLHASVARMTGVYEEFGQSFPPYETLTKPRARRSAVVICPPAARRSAQLRHLGRTRTAVLTGWAVDPGCCYQYQTDAAFPLSDHADYPDLIEFVRRVAPRKVYTLHGFAADFAATLRELGFDASACEGIEQLNLGLGLDLRSQPISLRQTAARRAVRVEPDLDVRQEGQAVAAGFLGFSQVCQAIAEVRGKHEKSSLLGQYLRTLEPESVEWVVTWCAGHPFSPRENRVLRVGWALIRDALAEVSAAPRAALRWVYLKHSDLGETAAEVLASMTEHPTAPGLTLSEVRDLFKRLQTAPGPSAQRPWLTAGLRRCSPLEAKFLVKTLAGNLRIGLKEGLVEASIGEAFEVTVEEVHRANSLLGDMGETALLARQHALHSASLRPFRPVKFMLASPVQSAQDIWNRFAGGREGTGSVWVEDTLDGIRCQCHKQGDRVGLYGRDLRRLDEAFPELIATGVKLPGDLILDAEILAMHDQRPLPLAELQKRLGGREADLFLDREIPVCCVVFDLLWINGESLVDRPLTDRRAQLNTLGSWPSLFRPVPVCHPDSPEAVDELFEAARARGGEGLMVKDPRSVYAPGRRGKAWLKYERAPRTPD